MNWISVKERLPEKGEDVLLFVNGEGYKTGCTVGHYAGARGIFYNADPESHGIYFSGITHWMPLPEPPKGGQIMKWIKTTDQLPPKE